MSKAKNVTFNLPPDLIDKYKVYVKHKYIPSVNAGVKEALEEYSKRIEKEMLKSEMIKAAKDPLFMDDLNENMKAFEESDAEAEKGNTEW
ncbi:hypothetical protein [Cohnella silvisoli]|uniref:CopG family transcriptional regulator n=1 Tax=Cohnella silvisoli TaxID=2873699 RepID=A0ABV1KQ72_9BACL|nr:hypothetical protein [Cohnella silvisoli]MCD9022110.1 hypothetical protein [Cohnella silvisoli]